MRIDSTYREKSFKKSGGYRGHIQTLEELSVNKSIFQLEDRVANISPSCVDGLPVLFFLDKTLLINRGVSSKEIKQEAILKINSLGILCAKKDEIVSKNFGLSDLIKKLTSNVLSSGNLNDPLWWADFFVDEKLRSENPIVLRALFLVKAELVKTGIPLVVIDRGHKGRSLELRPSIFPEQQKSNS